MNEHTPAAASYESTDESHDDQQPQLPSIAEVNMSQEGQDQLMDIVRWYFEDPEDQERLDAGADLLDKCVILYGKNIAFLDIKECIADLVARDLASRSTPADMDIIPEMYR